MKKGNRLGVTLLELVIAVLILSTAVIPIAGLVSKDTKNTAILAHSQYAMELARYTMVTLLDAIDFDDLLVGDPATLSGTSKSDFSGILFGNEDGLCDGNIDYKGYHYHVSLRAIAIPDADLGLEAYKNPPVNLFLQRNENGRYNKNPTTGKTYFDIAIEKEQVNNTPSCFEDATSIYQVASWGEDLESFDLSSYYEAQTPTITSNNLMKGLILKISWNDRFPTQPLGAGSRSMDLVAHKARLKKNGS